NDETTKSESKVGLLLHRSRVPRSPSRVPLQSILSLNKSYSSLIQLNGRLVSSNRRSSFVNVTWSSWPFRSPFKTAEFGCDRSYVSSAVPSGASGCRFIHALKYNALAMPGWAARGVFHDTVFFALSTIPA